MIASNYNVRIRGNYQSGGRLSASSINDLASAINGMRGEGGITVSVERTGIVISVGKVETRTKAAFGIQKINKKSGVVTVSGGLIYHGLSVAEIGAADVTVSGGTAENPVYCALRYVYNSKQGSILTTTVGQLPMPTQQAWQMPLWSAYKINGRIIIKEELWSGIVLLPSVFA